MGDSAEGLRNTVLASAGSIDRGPGTNDPETGSIVGQLGQMGRRGLAIPSGSRMSIAQIAQFSAIEF